MFLDEERLTDLIIKHKINLNQFYFMYLIHSGSSTIYRIAEEGKKFYRNEINELQEKNLIINLSKSRSALDDEFVMNENSPEGKEILDYFNSDLTMGDELWTAYPWHFKIGDKTIPAKTCDRDEISEIYMKKIKGSIKLHKEILRYIKRGTGLGLISMGIEKFVKGEQWNFLKEELEKNVSLKSFGTNEFT